MQLSSSVQVQFAKTSFNSLNLSSTNSDSLNLIVAESLLASSQALDHGPRPSLLLLSQALSPL
ncbi:hypothetical protein PanWU01x14_250220, partial [Parasponia andersonii]